MLHQSKEKASKCTLNSQEIFFHSIWTLKKGILPNESKVQPWKYNQTHTIPTKNSIDTPHAMNAIGTLTFVENRKRNLWDADHCWGINLLSCLISHHSLARKEENEHVKNIDIFY